MSAGFSEAAARLVEFPFFRRELLALLRSRRAFWLLVATVGVSSLVPILSWPGGDPVQGDPSKTIELLRLFLLTQLVLAVFVTSAFAAGSISGERERGTIDLLYMTLLSPVAIVFSKALAPVAYTILLLAASAPAACVLYLLGGVEFGTIVESYSLTFAAVMTSALLCLHQSMRARRTSLNVLIAMFLIAPACLILASITISSSSGQEFPWFGNFFVFLGIILWLVSKLMRNSRTPYLPSPRLPDAPPSSFRMSRPRPQGRRILQRQPRAWLMKTMLEEGVGKISFLENPIFLKETCTEFFFGRPAFRLAIFGGSLALFFFLTASFSTEDALMARGASHETLKLGFHTALSLIALFLPGAAATSFSREIEQGNLDFLRSTLLSWREILLGKFLASLLSCAGLPCSAAVWAILTLVVTRDAWSFVVFAGALFLTYVFITTQVTFVSVFSRRSTTALVASYAAVLGFLLVPVLVFRVRPPKVLAFLHPVFAFEGSLHGLRTGLSPGLPFLGFALLCVAAAYALLRLSGWYLEKFRSRDV